VTYLLDTNAISELMRADLRVEKWIAGLDERDRILTCTIVRGEIFFGISRLPAVRRREELEQTGRQFSRCILYEPVDFYATIKLARQSQGLALDENDLCGPGEPGPGFRTH